MDSLAGIAWKPFALIVSAVHRMGILDGERTISTTFYQQHQVVKQVCEAAKQMGSNLTQILKRRRTWLK